METENNNTNLAILYEDNDIVVINKPHGLLVHRSKTDFYEKESAVDQLRSHFQKNIYTVHRLDKPTSGVLIFAFNKDSASSLSKQFENRSIKKEYVALVRGKPQKDGLIDHPLVEEKDPLSDKKARSKQEPQDAQTEIQTLKTIELPIQVDKYPTSIYSLVRAIPKTGRKHQIRRHLRHINCPIIGDINHGSSKHNRFFENEYNIRRLLLACTVMTFHHPKTGVQLSIKASLSPEFSKLLNKLGISYE